jgi:choline dehydrogenase-like flavoprotein
LSRGILIVGSGPAAVGAALAAVTRPDIEVTVIDVGGQLEQPNADTRSRMASIAPAAWDPGDTLRISELPVDSKVKGLPEKRAYGSNFPFRDYGQRAGIRATTALNDALVSGAYGGFSNVWGAQVMPFTEATFRTWPVHASKMLGHYAAILERIPYAAEEDDLAALFPVLGGNDPLPPLSDRSTAVLERYARHRRRFNARGVLLGRARLAMDAPACIRAGLCMTGCPYSLIYSAAHTLDGLRDQGALKYHRGLLAVRVEEDERGATVVARELGSGRLQRFTADRVLLACGAIGTSRLVMGSLGLSDTTARVAESMQFVLPFASALPVGDPRERRDFTLNQFNMVVTLDEAGYDVSVLHFYTYNPAFLQALPGFLRTEWAKRPRAHLLRRLSVAIGYLPSWRSPSFTIRVQAPRDEAELPPLLVSGDRHGLAGSTMFRQVLRRIAASAPALDLWPVLPMLRISAGGKSYHWGSVFPHSDRPSGRFASDTLGRVAPWQRIHVVDASVFPTVPATTFTLTIMANAHRIASEAVAELS